MRGVIVEMIGKRYGRWTVLEYAQRPEYTSSTAQFYRCRCDCGKEKIVSGASLRNGYSKSCGCLRNELSRERSKRRAAARKAAAERE